MSAASSTSFAAQSASEVVGFAPIDMLSLSVSSLTPPACALAGIAGDFLGGPRFLVLSLIAGFPSFVAGQKETTNDEQNIVEVQTENVNEHG